MTRPFAAVALLVLAIGSGSASAQSISTSKGLRALPLTTGYKQEAQFAAAERIAEDVARELLADATAREAALGTVPGEVAGLNEQIRREQAGYERARASFAESDDKYRRDLAAFEQRQTALAADIDRQREQAAALKAQPATAAAAAEFARLNDWARQLAGQRADLETEGQRLLAERERVEAERTRLAAQRVAAEARLKERRDQTVGDAGARQQQRAEVYRQLRVVVDYLRRVRADASKLDGRARASSATLEEAEARLLRFEQGQAAK